MYGSTIGTLNVIVNGNETVFSKSGNKGNQWFERWIDISFSGMGMVSNMPWKTFIKRPHSSSHQTQYFL